MGARMERLGQLGSLAIGGAAAFPKTFQLGVFMQDLRFLSKISRFLSKIQRFLSKI